VTPSRLEIRVPASSANLGSGFDALGLALGSWDTVEVLVGGTGLAVEVDDHGAGDVADVPRDETHLVYRALRSACAHLGFPVPGLFLRCTNAIPHARGLGSSAAAVVAGLAAGYALAGRELDAAALGLAAEFEGHADNAAASLLGGLVLVFEDAGKFHARRLRIHPAIRPVLAVPLTHADTDVTRGMLPREIAHSDAVFGVGRAALAVHALTVEPDLLLPATQDRLHERYRASAYPDSAELVRELRAAGVPAVISGAGPSVLALTTTGVLPEAVASPGFTVTEQPVDGGGVAVTAHP